MKYRKLRVSVNISDQTERVRIRSLLSIIVLFFFFTSTSVALRARKQTENSVDDRLGRDLLAGKVPAVQALERVLARLHGLELDVNISISGRVNDNGYNITIFLLAFIPDVGLKVFDPAIIGFPAIEVSLVKSHSPLNNSGKRMVIHTRTDQTCSSQ